MKDNNTALRIQIAQGKALEDMDYLLETHATPDFIQITGSIGGDVITRRYYDDGSVYAK